jgi:chromosome segregation ATPase
MFETSKTKLKEQNIELQRANDALQRELTEVKAEFETACLSIEQLVKDKTNLSRALKKVQDAYREIKDDLKTYHQEKTGVEDALRSITGTCETTVEHIGLLTNLNDKAISAVANLEQLLIERTSELKKQRSETERLKDENTELRQLVESLQNKLQQDSLLFNKAQNAEGELGIKEEILHNTKTEVQMYRDTHTADMTRLREAEQNMGYLAAHIRDFGERLKLLVQTSEDAMMLTLSSPKPEDDTVESVVCYLDRLKVIIESHLIDTSESGSDGESCDAASVDNVDTSDTAKIIK